MPKTGVSEKWIETGYQLFSQEGIPGIQIERMSRILGLNKSSFYHYFGTLEIFLDRLITHHHNHVELLVSDIKKADFFDPDLLNTLIQRQVTVMVQVQLKNSKSNSTLLAIGKIIEEQIDQAILPVWANYIGIPQNSGLAYKYLECVRDAFYTRISFEQFTYCFLHEFASGAKEIANQMQTQNFLLKVNA
jgi:AcrR family transcriptional regulator